MKLIHALLSLAAAAALPLRAQTITETFDGNSLPSSLQVVSGSEFALPTGSIRFDGGYWELYQPDPDYDGFYVFHPRVTVATSFSGYYDLSVTIEVVFQPARSDTAIEPLYEGAMFHFGLGTLASFSSDQPGEQFMGLRFRNMDNEAFMRIADLGLGENGEGAILANAWTAERESLARIVWNGTTKTATFLVDIGNDGSFDVTSSAINGADNGYTSNNLRIGFGGSLGSYVTSFSVAPTAVPEPSTYALWTGLAACACGLLRRRPRRV